MRAKPKKRHMKNFRNTLATVWQQKVSRSAPLLLAVFVFGCLGTYLLVSSHAATSTVSFEPETGTLSAAAKIIADSTASGSSGVKFGTGTSSGSCATSTPNVPDGPDPWGGCFPGPTSTGPNNSRMLASDKKTLTAYSGPCTITTD